MEHAPEEPTTETGQPIEPRYDQQHRRLCKAHRTDGEPCNAPAMNGQTVCRVHGGATRQARAKAKLRLAELVDPAISALAKEMEGAEQSGDRIRAANSILDRAGYGRTTKIETSDARDVLIEKLMEMREERDG